MSNIPSLQRGQLVGNDFLLQKPLSDNPLGAAWRVLDQRRGLLVCVRFLPEAFRSNPSAMDRFKRQFPAVQAFRHPHVVTPDRFVEDPVAGPFWISRCVDGLQLDDYATQWIQAEGKFPFQLIFDVLRPVAAALDEAKSRNLQHRSLSPRSIIVSSTEGVQVLGFELVGIVREELDPKFWNDNPERLRYLPPGQLNGKTSSDGDGSGGDGSDQYSLAAITYELLGGIIVAPGTALPQLPGQPEYVNKAMQRALQRDPAGPFSSCQQFLDTLSGAVLAVPLPPQSSVSVPQASPIVIQTQPSATQTVTQSPAPSATSFQNFPGAIPPSSQPVPQNLEAITSFEKITSAATRAKASNIERKINQDRRFQQFFQLWNIAVFLVVCVIAFMFRDRLALAWNQHFGQKPTATSSEEQVETDQADVSPSVQNKSVTKTPGNEKSPEKTAKSTEPTPTKAPRSRSTSKPKEPDFNGSNQSSFKGIDVDETPDEVRFVGTSGIGKRIVFVVDASAAMGSGVQQTPLAHAWKELAFSFKDLNSTQQFQVVYFNDEAQTLPSDGTDLISAKPENLKQAYKFLETIKGNGKADPINALLKAVSFKPDLIFFFTDEKSVQMNVAQIELVKKQAGKTPINTVEIGNGMEPDSPPVVKQLAQACNGQFQWVNATMHNLSRAP